MTTDQALEEVGVVFAVGVPEPFRGVDWRAERDRFANMTPLEARRYAAERNAAARARRDATAGPIAALRPASRAPKADTAAGWDRAFRAVQRGRQAHSVGCAR